MLREVVVKCEKKKKNANQPTGQRFPPVGCYLKKILVNKVIKSSNSVTKWSCGGRFPFCKQR